MPISLAIQIGNKEYNVIGENEKLIREAAETLNKKITEITSKSSNSENIQPLTKTTLAALNIAESELMLKNTWNNANKDIANEINRIIDFIDTNINKSFFE